MKKHQTLIVKKTVRYYAVYKKQAQYDPDDGTEAGWYAWIATEEGGQSDYCFGAFASLSEAKVKTAAKLVRICQSFC